MTAKAPSKSLVPCRCALPSHEQPRCPNGAILASRGSVYAGLYDSRSGAPSIRRAAASRPLRQVRLLNPDYSEDDAAGRRFAQLEIDD
jgi:hypothetical protein